MIESKIEKYLFDGIKKVGGKCLKWNSANTRGVPDRIVFVHSTVYFIELKSTVGRRSGLQEYFEKIIKSYNQNYLVINSKEQVDDFIRSLK